MITAKILKDSISPDDGRLTTFELTYPRFIHSEFMTHRCFARNAASSRAIPIAKMMNAVKADPQVIEFWGSNKPGMQAGEPLVNEEVFFARMDWAKAADEALHFARVMSEDHHAHKQIANRLLEPFSHITIIATATNIGLANFFHLRCHPDAQPEFQMLAYRMLDAYLQSTPVPLEWGEWHLPMWDGLGSTPELQDLIELRDILKVCTGRIARISYITHHGVRDWQEDRHLHDRLLAAGHWSPFEHCAQAKQDRLKSVQTGCFGPHWLQYRKTMVDETRRKLDPVMLMERKPDWITLP